MPQWRGQIDSDARIDDAVFNDPDQGAFDANIDEAWVGGLRELTGTTDEDSPGPENESETETKDGVPSFRRATETSECCVPSFSKVPKVSTTEAEANPPKTTSDHTWFYTITKDWTTIERDWPPPTYTYSTEISENTATTSEQLPTSTDPLSSNIPPNASSSDILKTTTSTEVLSPPPTQSTYNNNENPEEEDQDKLSNGATVGIVIGVVSMLLTVIFLARCIYNKKRQKHKKNGSAYSPNLSSYHSDAAGATTAGAAAGPTGPRLSGPHLDAFGNPVSPQLNAWLSQHAIPSVSVPWSSSRPRPPQDANIEMRSFTRPPARGPPTMQGHYTGSSGTTTTASAGFPGEFRPQQPVAPHPGSQVHMTGLGVPPPPRPAAGATGATAATASNTGTTADGLVDRAAALPWDDAYQNRYRAW